MDATFLDWGPNVFWGGGGIDAKFFILRHIFFPFVLFNLFLFGFFVFFVLNPYSYFPQVFSCQAVHIFRYAKNINQHHPYSQGNKGFKQCIHK